MCFSRTTKIIIPNLKKTKPFNFKFEPKLDAMKKKIQSVVVKKVHGSFPKKEKKKYDKNS